MTKDQYRPDGKIKTESKTSQTSHEYNNNHHATVDADHKSLDSYHHAHGHNKTNAVAPAPCFDIDSEDSSSASHGNKTMVEAED